MERFDGFHPPDGGDKRQKEVVEVTQLVGAICDKGKALVAVSDRMLTGPASTYEQSMSKGVFLSDNAFAMLCGSVEIGYSIANWACQYVRENNLTKLNRIVEQTGRAFQEAREHQIVQNYLGRYGIRSMKHWHQVQRELRDGVATTLAAQIQAYKLDVQLMVAGISDGRAHLYVVNDSKGIEPRYMTGFCCVGSGWIHAATTFARYSYDMSFSLSEALYVAYEAKGRAELAPGVGQATDVFVVDSRGIHVITQETHGQLKEMYEKNFDPNPRQTVTATVEGLVVGLSPATAVGYEEATEPPTQEPPPSSTDDEQSPPPSRE